MWFDPRKLLATANFQDVPDFATTDAGLAGAEGGVGSAGLEPADFPGGGPPAGTLPPIPALPGQGGGMPAPDALAPGFSESEADLFGQGTPEVFSGSDPNMGLAGDNAPGTAGGGATPGATPSDSTSSTLTSVPGTPGGSTPFQPGERKPASAPSGPGVTTQPQPPAAGAAGGAANPMAQLASALQGVARAAQTGNPQAQQLMNMLRQMQMMGGMGGMGGMMGGGQQYNPYMNQFMNPWAARMRMEQMRRHFMERERLRRQLYGHTPTGGRHGR